MIYILARAERKGTAFQLRPITEDDIELIRQWRNATRTYFIDTSEITREQQKKWFKAYREKNGDIMMMLMKDDEPISCCALYNIQQISGCPFELDSQKGNITQNNQDGQKANIYQFNEVGQKDEINPKDQFIPKGQFGQQYNNSQITGYPGGGCAEFGRVMIRDRETRNAGYGSITLFLSLTFGFDSLDLDACCPQTTLGPDLRPRVQRQAPGRRIRTEVGCRRCRWTRNMERRRPCR